MAEGGKAMSISQYRNLGVWSFKKNSMSKRGQEGCINQLDKVRLGTCHNYWGTRGGLVGEGYREAKKKYGYFVSTEFNICS